MRVLFFLLFFLVAATAQTPATMSWWNHVKFLADDKMQGREAGSAGYRAAARYVVDRFQAAGLKPAGEKGGYLQSVPLRVYTLRPGSTVRLAGESPIDLRINDQIAVDARPGIPETLDAPLVFAGAANIDVEGKIAVILSGTPLGPLKGAKAIVSISNPNALETPRWPIAYAKSMSIEGEPRPTPTGPFTLRFNADHAALLFAGSGHSVDEILALAKAGKPQPSFLLPQTLHAKLQVDSMLVESDNILAVLPGSDLEDEYLVVSAHLDGYGIGTPVNGDKIYNGAFDDAACVANLLELARSLKNNRRSVLFAVFTAEEKGLLGSRYFTSHFTVPKEKIVADINLDYIRPIFPLEILTTLGLTESTLGATARQVAEPLGIRIQPDNEPERGLFRRSDQYNFIRAGIPGIAFIFGYKNGSPEEATYRDWYAHRYHRPSDDLQQPVDWDAAAKFHRFFSRLAETVANDTSRPRANL